MALLFWLLFGLLVATQGLSVKKVKDDDKDLEWPNQFTLKAKRMSLTSSVIEDYTIWKTSKQSRIDYNNGYVSSIALVKKRRYPFGVKYEIHPEANFSQKSKSVCYRTVGLPFNGTSLETILPEAYNFVPKGEEVINDKECTKFVYDYKEHDGKIDVKSSVWAEYDEDEKVWIPVRHEVLEFYAWLGLKRKHEIWDFYSYSNKFSFRKVFSVEDNNCVDAPNTHTMDSEKVTKNLLFVDPEKDEHVDHVFNAFKNTYSRNYADDREHAMRRSIFKNNMRKVIEHNRQNLGYKISINQFADKTPDERERYMGLRKRPEGKVGTVPFPYDEDKLNDMTSKLPEEYDARLLGLVSNIKNQEDCGSCWTFGTTAAVEGALARANGGKLMALSNQALIDCAWTFGAAGCNGGSDNAAYEWMMLNGLPTEMEYGPYTNKDGICQIKNMTKIFSIRGYTDVTPFSVAALKVALVNHGPLSVSVHATNNFVFYSSGIFYDNTCNKLALNHEVSLVGYGQRDGDTFWILKNSWGPSWGIGGYMHISARDNACGVTTEPTYVVI